MVKVSNGIVIHIVVTTKLPFPTSIIIQNKKINMLDQRYYTII